VKGEIELKIKFMPCDIVRKKCNFLGSKLKQDDKEKDQLYMIWEIDNCFVSGYAIVSLANGNMEAWWDEDYLEFVRKGSRKEYLSVIKLIKERKRY
jgi:hypothetical protein